MSSGTQLLKSRLLSFACHWFQNIHMCIVVGNLACYRNYCIIVGWRCDLGWLVLKLQFGPDCYMNLWVTGHGRVLRTDSISFSSWWHPSWCCYSRCCHSHTAALQITFSILFDETAGWYGTLRWKAGLHRYVKCFEIFVFVFELQKTCC